MRSHNLYKKTSMKAQPAAPTLSVLVILGLLFPAFAIISDAQSLPFNDRFSPETSAPCGALSFSQAAGSPFTASSPTVAATADFNGDGKPDLVATDTPNAAIQVFLGDGIGGFTPLTPLSFGGGSPLYLAVADFDLDGKTDVATSFIGAGVVGIILGNGQGGFSTPSYVNTNFTNYLASSDFNLDGKPDLAVTGGTGHPVTIMLGDGHGNFAPAPTSPLNVANSFGSVVADFNLDGKPDLAVANLQGGNVSIFLGNGSGGFAPAAGSPVTIGGQPDFMAGGDFNSDGKPDLAVNNNGSVGMTILLGNGSGGFTQAPGSPIASERESQSLIAADFNLDGKPDIASIRNGSNSITILMGDGSGGFLQPAGTPVNLATSTAIWLASGDFNIDGRPELAVTSQFDNKISVELNRCTAAPTPTPTPTPSPTPGFVTVDGRVMTPDSRGLRNATVSMTDLNGNTRSTTTSSFGLFSFDDVPAGQTYTLRVSSRMYRFQPQTVTASNSVTLPNFVGLE